MAETMQALVADIASRGGLPPRPGPALDPYLDAAADCVRRYGWSRTSPRDVARAAGVERTTIYRHLGSRDDIFRLLIAREVHTLIDQVVEVAATGAHGPHTIVEIVASAVEYCLGNPVIAKLLDDDPELVTGFLADGIPDVLDAFTSTLSPVLAAGMHLGLVARRDPVIVTQWVVRVGLSLLLAPPPGHLRDFLAELLVPALTVQPAGDTDDPTGSR